MNDPLPAHSNLDSCPSCTLVSLVVQCSRRRFAFENFLRSSYTLSHDEAEAQHYLATPANNRSTRQHNVAPHPALRVL